GRERCCAPLPAARSRSLPLVLERGQSGTRHTTRDHSVATAAEGRQDGVMADQDEHQLVDDLKRPENLPGSAGQVEFISTHISLVFRTAAAVFKVKRAKNYGFLDYSTKELRERFCRAEVTLNRRLAPDVYLDVLPVYRDASGYSLVRPGEVVDHAVHMKRLPDDRSALSLLQRGALVPADLERLANRLARFYRAEEALPETSQNIRTSVEENFQQLRPFV